MKKGFVGAVLLLAASGLRGDSRTLSVSAGGALEAGQRVEVSWSLAEPGARGYSEVELVLSLDGGRTFPVRITRDLAPETESYLLTMPSLPALHARLALRAGDDGEPGEERLLAVTDDFSIAVNDGAALEPAVSARGEWWAGDALLGGTRALPDPMTLGDASPAVRAEAGLHQALFIPRPRPLGAPTPGRIPSSLEAEPGLPPSSSPFLLPRLPAHSPRRE